MALAKKRAAGLKDREKVSEIDAMVKSGDQATAYEALQLYRSRSNRAKQRGDIDAAIRLASQGSKNLLINGYDTAGYEMACVMLELFEENGKDLDPDTRSALIEVDEAFKPDSPSRIAFLKSCVKWSAAHGQRKLGDPLVHSRLALSMWESGEKRLAMYHFAAGECPQLLVEKLCVPASMSNAEAELERDRLFTLAILHYLSLENLRDSHELVALYKKSLKLIYKKDYQSDLLSFSDYLTQTSRRDALPLFKKLCNTYSNVLNYDPVIPTLLTGPIGQRLFGLEPPKADMMTLLQGMFR
jgi:hypothetical protein